MLFCSRLNWLSRPSHRQLEGDSLPDTQREERVREMRKGTCYILALK
jgi:hypothetical protein